MASTDLKLDEPGALPKPGPIGRIARIAFGLLCVWYVASLFVLWGNLIAEDGHIRSVVWNGIIPDLFLISYIVNIGFSRAWGKRPAIVSAAAIAAMAGIGFVLHGRIETEILAQIIWVWEVYAFGHLGLAFLVSGLIGTPGCEMSGFTTCILEFREYGRRSATVRSGQFTRLTSGKPAAKNISFPALEVPNVRVATHSPRGVPN